MDIREFQWLDRPCEVKNEDLSDDAIRLFIQKTKEMKRIPYDVQYGEKSALNDMYLFCGDKLSLTAAILLAKDPDKYCPGSFLKIESFDNEGTLLNSDILRMPVALLPAECMRVLSDKYLKPTPRFNSKTNKVRIEYTYPLEAVRELVVNAIVHKDYSIDQEVSIGIYKDKLTIYSPGILPQAITLEDLKVMHTSIRCNRRLADAFHALRYVECWGQGLPRVMRACKDNGNPEPEFTIKSDGLLVTLRPKEI